MIGVSRMTLHRRIRELVLEEETRYSENNYQELDVRTILALLPNSGEAVIRDALCGQGVRIQRSRLRESIQRVDPTRRERSQRESKIRRKKTNSRQILSERASNGSATSNSSVKTLCLISSYGSSSINRLNSSRKMHVKSSAMMD